MLSHIFVQFIKLFVSFFPIKLRVICVREFKGFPKEKPRKERKILRECTWSDKMDWKELLLEVPKVHEISNIKNFRSIYL